MRWEKSSYPLYKKNVDGASSGHGVAAATILRAWNGIIVGRQEDFCRWLSVQNRLQVAILGSLLAGIVGVHCLLLEMDCATVAARIKSGGRNLFPLGAFACMTRNSLVALPCVDILIVYREQNRLADCLATYAYDMSDQTF